MITDFYETPKTFAQCCMSPGVLDLMFFDSAKNPYRVSNFDSESGKLQVYRADSVNQLTGPIHFLKSEGCYLQDRRIQTSLQDIQITRSISQHLRCYQGWSMGETDFDPDQITSLEKFNLREKPLDKGLISTLRAYASQRGFDVSETNNGLFMAFSPTEEGLDVKLEPWKGSTRITIKQTRN